MKKSEFDSLSNDKKVEYLNKYLGKTAQFKVDNDFSWTYATGHCNYVKQGQQFVATEEPVYQIEDEDQLLLTVIKFQKSERCSKSYRLPKPLLESVSEYAIRSVLKETDIVVCALKEFLDKYGTKE